MSSIYFGNARADGKGHEGWFFGHFMKPPEIRQSRNVQIKWAFHFEPYAQARFKHNLTATTLCMAITGGCTFEFRENGKETTARLSTQGYVVWGPSVQHRLAKVHQQVQLVVVRWPSVSDDQVDDGSP